MSKQEATRLADALEPLGAHISLMREAATLLRRWPDGERIAALEAALDFAHRALNNPASRDLGDAAVRKIEEVR